MEELFVDGMKRDERAWELKAQGHKVRRGTVRNQQLHPMYVEDRKDTPEGRDRGFGNTVYKLHWPRLFTVEIKR